MNVQYRMTIFAGASYSTSSAVLTPAAGAPHSDPFRVTTMQGLAGYKPFMQAPTGEACAVEIDRNNVRRGNYAVRLLDKSTDGTNPNRWVTAFLGNASGQMHILGRNTVIEESLDGGATWQTFFCGRVERLGLSNPLFVEFQIEDNTELLKSQVFATVPRVNYAVFSSIIPAGLLSDLGVLDSNNTIEGVKPLEIASVSAGTDSRLIALTNAAINRSDNFYPMDELEATQTNAQIGTTTHGTEFQNAPLYARIWVSGTPYDFAVDFLKRVPGTKAVVNSTPPIAGARIQRLPNGAALTVLDNTSPKTMVVYRPVPDSGEGLAPFYLAENPWTIAADILSGKLFESSSVVPSVPFNSGSLVTLNTSGNIPVKTIFEITEPTDAGTWIQKNICEPFNVMYTYDSVYTSGSAPQSQIRFFSTKQPTSTAGLVEITGADVIADSSKEWRSTTPVMRVAGTFYVATEHKLNKDSTGTTLNANTQTISSRAFTEVLFPSSDNLVDSTFGKVAIDYSGLRSISKNAANDQSDATIYGLSTYKYYRGWMLRLMAEYLNRRKAGNPEVRLTLLRSTKVNSIKTGDFILVTVGVLPNQASHVRGGTRIFQVIQKADRGITSDVILSDAGVNSVMATPTLGTVTSPSINQVSFSVTTSVDSLIEIQIATVTPGASVPADSSAQWITTNLIRVNATSTIVTLDSIPNGRRMYVRIRATSPIDGDLQLSSAWVTSTGTELNAVDKPTSVNVSSITTRTATVTWTNTETRPVDVFIASPAGVPTIHKATIAAGSTKYFLTGLHKSPSTGHTVGVRYRDDVLGVGQFASASFTASGSAGKNDAPASIDFFR